MSKTCILVDHSDFLNMVGADEDASSNEPHHSEFITLDEASSHLDHASSHQQQSQEHQSVELLSREHSDVVAASFYQHFNINPSLDRRNNIICDEDTNADESVITENNNQELINVEEINNNDEDDEEEKREEYVNDEYYENEECNPNNNPTNSRPSSIPSSPAKQTQPNARRSSSTLVLSTFPALTPPQSAVPKLANDEQVFESLCKKIAKYCQLLSKLTSCEVFYKAELTLSSQSGVNQSAADNSDDLAAVSAAATLGSSSRTRPKRYQPKKARNPNVRSLYWGTDRLVRDFTHDRGIRFERLNGDSLISIEPALAISVENIESIIDEIVNGPALMPKKKYRQAPPPEIVREKQVPSPPPTISSLPSVITPSQSSSSLNPIVLKDSYVLLDRLNERVVDEHLNKLEQSNFVINFERSLNNTDTNDKINEYDNQEFNDTEENIYSDSDEHNLMNGKSQTLLNETEVYTCEICPHHSYRHLTQLKLHQLRMHHENNDEYIEYSDERRQLLEDRVAPYRCAKCGQEFGDQRLEYRKHMITCVEPDAYACKTCDRVHASYDHYRMHVTYVHPPLVYMCTVCGRKYRRMCDLVEHDRFGCSPPPPQSHSHANINILDSDNPRSSAADSEVASHHSCEFCHAVFVSRQQLFQHYLSNHLRRSVSSNENNLDDEEDEKEESSNEESHQIETINSRRSNLKEPQPMTHEPSPSTPITQKITLESSTNNSVVVLNRSSDELLHHADDETDDDVNMNNSTAVATTTTATPPAVDKKTLIRGLIDRKYQCRWCELKFYQKKHLQHHEQSHHKNRMLTCPVCDKTFERKDRLNGHMKCHMEPSLECKICGKKFKRPCNLYNHELVHGLTEHAFMLCQFCNRGFRSRRDYQNHVLANHRDVILSQNGGSQQQKDDNNNNNEEELNNQLLDSSQTPPPSTAKSSSSKSSRRAAQKHSSTDHLSSSSGSNQSIKIVSHEMANTTNKKLVVKIVDNSATQMTSNSTSNGVKRKRTETEASETYITRTETIDLSDEHLAHLLGVANETTDFG